MNNNNSYEIYRLNYYYNIFSDYIINFILCIKKFWSLSTLDLFIPFDTINYIISIFIKCKLYNPFKMSCGGNRSMITFNNKIIRCPCNNNSRYELNGFINVGRSLFHWCKDEEILLHSVEEERAFIYTTKGLKEYNLMGGKPLGFIDFNFPYHLISMSSCYHHTLFHTKEGLCINYYYDKPINQKPYYKNNENIMLPHVIFIACKWESIFVFTIDGLYVCGDNNCHELGDGDALYLRKFKKISIDNNIISIECGMNHTLLLTLNGLYGCGISDYFSGVHDIIINTLIGTQTFCCKNPQKLNISNVISMSCGASHSLVLTNDGLYGCGKNHFGQSGVELNPFNYFQGFQKININNILSFSCGPEYSIIMTDKGLFSCGYNFNTCYIYTTGDFLPRPNQLRFMF